MGQEWPRPVACGGMALGGLRAVWAWVPSRCGSGIGVLVGWCLALLLLVAGPVRAEDGFSKGSVSDGRDSLPYRLLAPLRLEPGQRYPLVVFLHGAGERGRDNGRQVRVALPALTTPAVRTAHPCYVVAPQCPSGRVWVERRGSQPRPNGLPPPASMPMRLVETLIPDLVAELPIDPDRIYLCGLSMGGFGTWDLLDRHPDWFAAGAPICGGADLRSAPRIAPLPLWVFHGGNDPVISVDLSRTMVRALVEAGGDPGYTEYRGVGHACWDLAFSEPGFLDWLFAQRRSGIASPLEPSSSVGSASTAAVVPAAGSTSASTPETTTDPTPEITSDAAPEPRVGRRRHGDRRSRP